MADTPVPTPIAIQQCDGCAYAVLVPSENDRMNAHWECRRYAPSPAPEGIQYWPMIEPTDWCGEFKNR